MSAEAGTAPVIERLRAMPPEVRALAVTRLAQRGLLATIEVPPVRLDPPGDELTCRQRALWELDHDGRHGDFYHCAALWFAPAVPAEALAGAYVDVAGGFDALGRVVDGTGGQPRARRVPAAAPAELTVPADVADPHGWVRAAVSVAASGPLDPARQPADVRVYALPDGSSALAVLGHDIHLDHQGLVQVLGPAVAARLAGTEPVVEEVRISDVAAWQRQRLNDGVLSVAVGSRREALRDAPVCPWPTGGNRAGRRLDVRSGARAGELLRELAARSGVSLASMTLAAWYRALVAWDARTSMLPIGCCTTARVRPELRTTLGNLTNTVIVAPGPQWSRFGSADLLDAAHQAMQEALGSVDLPFELVFGDGPVQDEQIGVRFTFVEDPPSSGDGPLRGAAVRFGYAKSLLSCEVHVSGGDLRVWVDYRPAQFAQQVPGRLAALLRQELTVRQRWAG